MSKSMKWVLAAAAGVAGLAVSFFVSPTLFECKLFTACHEVNIGYAIVSLFSSQAQSTISNEQLALQIAHSISLTLIGALIGFIVGYAVQLQTQAAAAAAIPPMTIMAQPEATALAGSVPAQASRAAELEMNGLDGFGEYYLKIDASELGQMPRGLVIGRSGDEATMVINHETISRRHARLIANGNTFMLEDLGSTNGTNLNGRALRPDEAARLGAGDRVRFGSVDFRITVA